MTTGAGRRFPSLFEWLKGIKCHARVTAISLDFLRTLHLPDSRAGCPHVASLNHITNHVNGGQCLSYALFLCIALECCSTYAEVSFFHTPGRNLLSLLEPLSHRWRGWGRERVALPHTSPCPSYRLPTPIFFGSRDSNCGPDECICIGFCGDVFDEGRGSCLLEPREGKFEVSLWSSDIEHTVRTRHGLDERWS